MNTLTTDHQEELVQYENRIDGAILREMQIGNALKRQQIQTTKDQNKLINILIHVHEEGMGLNETNLGWSNSRKSQEIISQYE